MRLVDQIVMCRQGVERFVKLFVGDLSAIPNAEAVDLLVVSAFPDDYLPTPSSLCGALARRGISVAELSRDKAVDLRRFSACWLSREISSANAGFRRLLCFEPLTRGRAQEVVGDIFRSIIPFVTDSPPIRQIAMPLVAAGDQGNSKDVMLEATVDAAVHWLSNGLPLDCVKIVFHDPADEFRLQAAFGRAKSRVSGADKVNASPWQFDLFVSYSHQDKLEVDYLVKIIKEVQPYTRVFLDRMELQPGAAWQHHLFEVIDQSRKVMAVFSPQYLESKVCLEEYNIAHFRHRESPAGVLQPIYLHTAPLPTYMKLIQFIDAREGSWSQLAEAAKQLAAAL